MARKRHTPDQIIRKLREAEAEQAAGLTIGQICRELEVTEQTFYRWRNQYGGMKSDKMKRLKELEIENTRLRKVVADQALDIQIEDLFHIENGVVYAAGGAVPIHPEPRRPDEMEAGTLGISLDLRRRVGDVGRERATPLHEPIRERPLLA